MKYGELCINRKDLADLLKTQVTYTFFGYQDRQKYCKYGEFDIKVAFILPYLKNRFINSKRIIDWKLYRLGKLIEYLEIKLKEFNEDRKIYNNLKADRLILEFSLEDL